MTISDLVLLNLCIEKYCHSLDVDWINAINIQQKLEDDV